MSVELSDDQYGSIARALVFIAAGQLFTEEGRRRRINRAEMMQRAREACAAIKLSYLGEGQGTSSFPDEVGLQYSPKAAAHGQ